MRSIFLATLSQNYVKDKAYGLPGKPSSQNNRPLHPKVAHNSWRVAHDYVPFAFQVRINQTLKPELIWTVLWVGDWAEYWVPGPA